MTRPRRDEVERLPRALDPEAWVCRACRGPRFFPIRSRYPQPHGCLGVIRRTYLANGGSVTDEVVEMECDCWCNGGDVLP